MYRIQLFQLTSSRHFKINHDLKSISKISRNLSCCQQTCHFLICPPTAPLRITFHSVIAGDFFNFLFTAMDSVKSAACLTLNFTAPDKCTFALFVSCHDVGLIPPSTTHAIAIVCVISV